MKVAMVLIKKPYHDTRALKPFFVTETYARIFETRKTARRLSQEEIEALGTKYGSKKIEEPVGSGTTRKRRGRPRKVDVEEKAE